MVAYAIRRVVLMVPLLFAVATLTFFLMHSVEGGPFDSDRPISDATRARLNERYNLDGSLLTQYTSFIADWGVLLRAVMLGSDSQQGSVQVLYLVTAGAGLCLTRYRLLATEGRSRKAAG